jgi:hypothetical protein
MKKMKRYEDGGEIESTQGQNKSIGDDVRARAMAAMSKSDGESEDTKYAKKLYSTEEPAIPKKTATKLTPKAAPKEEAPAPKAKASLVDQAKDVVKAKDVSVSTPKSFTESGGNTKASSKKEDLSGFSFGNMAKKLREKAGITSYKVGGKVKSASARADGCAIRGKTRA